MKLFRFGEPGFEKPGVVIDEVYYDVSAYISDFDEAFFEANGLSKLEAMLEDGKFPVANISRLGCPVKRPSKIVCIGLNYRDHAEETGAAIPAEPVIFLKSTTAIVGPNDDIMIPQDSEKTDWEVELAVVIQKKACYVSEEDAMHYVAGYCLHNDVSERAFQLERGGTWDKGKGCDTFAPIGPLLVTKDEIADVHNVNLWLSVNGQMMQQGNTRNLIYNIPFLVSYTSRFMTLLPGDIISTGTPAGVGLGMKPAVYLKAGDVVELGIDGLGSSKQNLVAFNRK
jgi:2-keto-4-pentenoate hydratase/2-oxohepta-3-ene-1,7-dioic acid hydratase in catechol pathway